MHPAKSGLQSLTLGNPACRVRAAVLFNRGAEVSTSTEQFAQYYRSLVDEELLNLALQRSELQETAASALDAEMASRNLGEDSLQEFRQRHHSGSRNEPQGEREDVSPEHSVVTELPPDWFDDEPENKDTTPQFASPRPKAATVLSLLFWLGGLIGFAWGLNVVWRGPGGSSIFLFASGIVMLVFGVFTCVTGVGLWRLRAWGRVGAAALCWINVAGMGLDIAANAYVRLSGFAVNPADAMRDILQFLISLGLALYFGGQTARRIFSQPDRDSCQ